MAGASRLLLILISAPLPPRHRSVLLLHHRRRLSSLSLSFRLRSNPQLLPPGSTSRQFGDFCRPPEIALEWSSFLTNLSAGGYFDWKERGPFHVKERVRGFMAWLAFAHDRPYLSREVDRRDVGVVIRSGSPNLPKSGEVSSQKMSSFLYNEDAAARMHR